MSLSNVLPFKSLLLECILAKRRSLVITSHKHPEGSSLRNAFNESIRDIDLCYQAVSSMESK